MQKNSNSPKSLLHLAGWAIFAFFLYRLLRHYARLIAGNGFDFYGHDLLDQVFTNMWHHLTKGEFFVDRAVIPGEAFLKDGKAYTYFGIFPALMRGFLSLFVDIDVHPVHRISSYIAVVFAMFAPLATGFKLGLHKGHTKFLFLLLCLTFCLTGPLYCNIQPPRVQEESRYWGMAFALWFNFFFLSFLFTPSKKWNLVGMAITSGLALHSRSTSGLPTFIFLVILLTFYLLGRLKKVSAKQITPAILVYVLLGLSVAFVNFSRWDTPFHFGPVHLHENMQGEEAKKLSQYGEFRLDRIPLAVEYFFLPHASNFKSEWPYIKRTPQLDFLSWSQYMGFIDYGAGLPLLFISVSLIAFFILGLRQVFRSTAISNEKPLLLAFAGSHFLIWLTILCYIGVQFRYGADFLPLMTTFSLVGVRLFKKTPEPVWMIGLSLLTAFSLYCSIYLRLGIIS